MESKKLKYPKYYINPRNFFIGFLTISFVTAFIIGGITIGKYSNLTDEEKGGEIHNLDDEAVSRIDLVDNWTKYNINNLNISLKLPDKLTKKGDWIENKIEGDFGTHICFTNKIIKENCEGELIILSAMKNDSSLTEDSFINVKGFEKVNNEYYLITNEEKIKLENVIFKEFENNKEFEIIKIVGTNINSTYPEEGYLGAVINTKDSTYPAITIQMKITGELNEFEFDQILNNILSSN